MIPQKQRVVGIGIGDCFAACMASLLELPIEVIPNDHSENWWFVWREFLKQFGLSLGYRGAEGAIWASHPWIASVKSKNYDCTHAIIMHDGGTVLFDPSTKKRYRKGESLLGKDIVVGGHVIDICDFSKIHKLEEYRQKLGFNNKLYSS